jgi:hypothetical protein
MHARTDGFTSLAVVIGVIGVWLGFPLADPLVGLVITVAILVLLWGTSRDIGRRLLDAVDPELVDTAEAALNGVREWRTSTPCGCAGRVIAYPSPPAWRWEQAPPSKDSKHWSTVPSTPSGTPCPASDSCS